MIQKEFAKLQESELTAPQLKKIKSQLKGQLAMAEEGNLNFMLMMAKNLLDREKIESIEEIFEQISFTKPGTGNRFLFCSICAIVKRSDTISRHFRN